MNRVADLSRLAHCVSSLPPEGAGLPWGGPAAGRTPYRNAP
jgi:hypothetical protein